MGCDVVVLDNLANSQLHTKTQLEEFTGRTVHFYEGDVRDGEILARVFEGCVQPCLRPAGNRRRGGGGMDHGSPGPKDGSLRGVCRAGRAALPDLQGLHGDGR